MPLTVLLALLAGALGQNLPQTPGGADPAPDLSPQAITALAERLGIPEERVELVDRWAVRWPNASLGLPEPGMAYAQVVVPGQCILVRADGTQYLYHAADTGRVVFAGEWVEPDIVQVTELAGLVERGGKDHVCIDGTLVLRQRDALFYEGPAEPDALPEREKPVLINGPALQPFISRTWGAAEKGAAVVRVTGKPYGPAHPIARDVQSEVGLLAERIQIIQARPQVPRLVPLADLRADPDSYHQTIVNVQGSLASSFGVCELTDLQTHSAAEPGVWVEGDLSGLARPAGGGAVERARVEVTGLFERRAAFDGANGFGTDGKWRCRITAKSVHGLGSVLSYEDLVERSADLNGSLVCVRGRLFLGEGLSDLTSLEPYTAGRKDPGCLISGDLSSMGGGDIADAAVGMPALVTGRLEVSESREGFGRAGTRGLRIEATTARWLSRDELPADPEVWPELAYVAERKDAPAGDLVARAPGPDAARPVHAGVLAFAASPDGAETLVVRPVENGAELLLLASEGDPSSVATAGTIAEPAWSPDAGRFAAIVDGVLRVYEAESLAPAAAGPDLTGSAARWWWSPDSRRILITTVEANHAETLVLDAETGDLTTWAEGVEALGWHAETSLIVFARQLPVTAEAPEPGGELVASTDPECAGETRRLAAYRPDERIVGFASSPVGDVGAIVTGSARGDGPVHLSLVPLGTEGSRRPLYVGASEITGLSWTPDGKCVSFLARRGGHWRAVMLSISGRRLVDAGEVLPVAPTMRPRPQAGTDAAPPAVADR